MTLRATIVIRAYNEGRHIGRLLAGLQGQHVRDFEIILVDSGSTDDTVALAERNAVQVLHIAPDEFTFGRSLNHGIAAAQGEFIVNISAHCYPMHDEWLGRLLAAFDDRQVALAYGMQRGDGRSRFAERRFFEHYYPEVSNPRQTDPFCNNANAAIRRALWEQNPYDESLTGLEDLAWASWALHAGHALAYVAEAGVIHVHEESPQQVYNRYQREAIAMKELLPHSRYKLRHAVSLFARYAWGDLQAAAREGVLLRKGWEILWFRWMQHWGTYRGYRHTGRVTDRMRQVFYYSPEILTRNRR
ncbi:MAG: glycosyltransferase family 2 protein [Anaerolineae bacterium]|nr:MAG: glycosyltransferase family 2 protein [Anaerolineae bacterium]